MYFYCKSLCIIIVVYVFLLFVHIFLTLSMYSYCGLCILIVRPCILNVVYVFLLWSMYSYCSSMYSYCCLCIPIVVFVFLDTATLTEVFPSFLLGCKANARVILAKMGHGPHSSKIVVVVVCIVCFVLFYVLFVCKCVLYYCHQVTTQLQLTNISYHICQGQECSLLQMSSLLWDPPSLQYNGYQGSFLGRNMTRVWCWPLTSIYHQS